MSNKGSCAGRLVPTVKFWEGKNEGEVIKSLGALPTEGINIDLNGTLVSSRYSKLLQKQQAWALNLSGSLPRPVTTFSFSHVLLP